MLTPSPLHVLVVEDDVQMLNYLCELLEGWGFHCDPAKSAREALAAVAKKCPDVVISDLLMPGMGGIELLHALREAKNCPPLFFVLITGQGTVHDVVRAVEEGADEVFIKPIKEPQLLGVLQRIEANRQVRPAT